MRSYVIYSMYGFNRKCQSDSTDSFEYRLSENSPYRYQNHPFLSEVFINNTITEITFYLQPGKNAGEYQTEIDLELEQICFNLIVHSDLPILQPYCKVKKAVNEDGTNMLLTDTLTLREDLFLRRQISAQNLYESAMNPRTSIFAKTAIYTELFFILHNPNKVIQFLGLYDILCTLIPNATSQKDVHDYFGKHKDQYPFIRFYPSRKNSSKMEDSFTHLRNAISHSKQVGVQEYLNIANSISDSDIKHLLFVINDLLCNQ